MAPSATAPHARRIEARERTASPPSVRDLARQPAGGVSSAAAAGAASAGGSAAGSAGRLRRSWPRLRRPRRLGGLALGLGLGLVHLRPDLLGEVGPGRLRLGLGGELALGVVEADVVALLVVGVLAEGLAVLLGDLAALGRLLDRQADPAALQVDVDDLDPQLLARGDDLLGQVDVVAGHLRDVHQALDAVAHLHEGAEGHQLGDAAVDELADRVACRRTPATGRTGWP